MKSEITLLLLKLKTSLSAILAVIAAFLTPIVPLIILVGVAIFADTIIGLMKARKLNDTITSRKLSNIISKLVLYEAAVVLFFCIEKYVLSDIIGLFCSVPLILTKVVSATLLIVELTSINENYQAYSGVNIWSKFKQILKRGKDLKEEIQNSVPDEKDNEDPSDIIN